MDERYTIRYEYVIEPRYIYPVYEEKYKNMYTLIGYRYDAVNGTCTYVLYPRKNQI